MNTIIKTMCEVMGDHQEDGGYLFPYNEQYIPVLLNKDETTFYPEIRISPFIQQNDMFTERFSEKTLRDYREWKTAKFQVDIFSQDLAEVNNIYLALRDRIYDFFNLEVLVYSYNKHFQKLNDNLYKNDNYYSINKNFEFQEAEEKSFRLFYHYHFRKNSIKGLLILLYLRFCVSQVNYFKDIFSSNLKL